MESAEKISFTKQQKNNLTKWFVCTWKVVFSDTIIEIFGCGVLLWVDFSSIFSCTKRNSKLCSLPRNSSEQNSKTLHLFWFHRMESRDVFSSAEGFGTELWEFASIFVPRNGIPSCFLFRGRVRNGIPRLSVPRNNRNSVGNNRLFCLFRLRGIIFCRKVPTLNKRSLELREILA